MQKRLGLAASSLCLVNLGMSTRLLNCVGKGTQSPGGSKLDALAPLTENSSLFINLTAMNDV